MIRFSSSFFNFSSFYICYRKTNIIFPLEPEVPVQNSLSIFFHTINCFVKCCYQRYRISDIKYPLISLCVSLLGGQERKEFDSL